MAATLVFYGSMVTDPAVLQSLPGPLLGIFGGADSTIPPEQVQAFEQALQQAQVPHEITVYAGQPHAFVADMQTVAAGGAAGQAWQQMLRFLQENLKQGGDKPAAAASDIRLPIFAWRYYLALAYAHAFGPTVHPH